VSEGPFSIGSTVWPGASRILEEAGELTQVLGKLIGSGGDTTHFDGSDLRDRLVEEIGDLSAAIAFFVVHNLPADEIDQRKRKKLAKYEKWHASLLPSQDSEEGD
jgi:NTP pyrophosphatase (non-canonical NTP hydrolase)